MGDEILGQLISRARESRVRVIASNHDFEKTPGLDEILARLHHMDRLGADILKIALMPRSADDVLTLLAATREMSARGSSRPLITMSMSGQGLISRLSGEFFGSCLTFGCLEGAPSAPGQIPARQLKSMLETLHTFFTVSP